MNKIITIDGPAGVGKTARAIDLANYLGYKFISFGYIFRAIYYALIVENGTMPYINDFKIYWTNNINSEPFHICYKGNDITNDLHLNIVIERKCIQYANCNDIEILATNVLQNLVSKGDCIIEGRNTNTLFDNTEISYFLQCSSRERLVRIAKEAAKKGLTEKNLAYASYLSDKRNIADKELYINHEGLVTIDSTIFSPNETLEEMLFYLKIRKSSILPKWDLCILDLPLDSIKLLLDDSILNKYIKRIFVGNNIFSIFKQDYSEKIFPILKFSSDNNRRNGSSGVVCLKHNLGTSDIINKYILAHNKANNLALGNIEDIHHLYNKRINDISGSFSVRYKFSDYIYNNLETFDFIDNRID